MEFPASILLFRVNQARNERRFYRLRIVRTLFGDTELMREFGRIGSSGRVMHDRFETASAAEAAFCGVARKKLQRGYRRIYQESIHRLAEDVNFHKGDASFDFIDDPLSCALLVEKQGAAVDLIRSLPEDYPEVR